MAVAYTLTLKTARMQAVVDAIDSGGAGTLEICTSAYAMVLSTHTLSVPCGVVVDDTITFSAIGDASGEGDGTAAIARIKNNGGGIVVSDLLVGTSGTDIVLDNGAVISSGNTVSISAGSLTHA